MPLHTIVAQSHSPGANYYTVKYHSTTKYIFSYRLTEPLIFQEPHFARLLWLGGSKETCLVFADFVESQNVNGAFEPYLGCSAAGSLKGWVPLASNHIPAYGYIHLLHTDRTKIFGIKKLTAIIEIAPESFLKDGTKSKA